MLEITGLGHLSCVGQGVSPLREALALSQNSVGVSPWRAPDVMVPGDLPESVVRRMSRISKMFYATAAESLSDAFGSDLAALRANPSRVGLVIGTAFGCLEMANNHLRRVLVEGPTAVSPTAFATSMHNTLASHISIAFGITGPATTVTTMEQTTMGSLRTAWDWIEQDMCDHVAVLIGDEVSDFHTYAMSHRPECDIILGEGVIGLVLSRSGISATPSRYGSLDLETVNNASNAVEADFFYRWDGPNGRPSGSHAHLFGISVTGSAFEIAAAVLTLGPRGKPVTVTEIDWLGRPSAATISPNIAASQNIATSKT